MPCEPNRRSQLSGTRWGFLDVISITAAIAALVLGSARAAAGRSGRHLFLDLTQPQVSQIENSPTWGCSEGEVGGTDEGPIVPPNFPLQLRIQPLRATRYRLGNQVTFDLLATNVGKNTLFLPWSVDLRLVYGRGCVHTPAARAGGLLGSVIMHLKDRNGRTHSFAIHYLYGVLGDDATYRELRPGGSLRIRTSDVLTPGHIDPAWTTAHGAVQLSASATFVVNPASAISTYSPSVSLNQVQIVIESK